MTEREKQLYKAEKWTVEYVPTALRNHMLILLRECSRLGMKFEFDYLGGESADGVEPNGKIRPMTLIGSLSGVPHPTQCHKIRFNVFPEARDSPRWHGHVHAFTMSLERMSDPDLVKIEYEIVRRAIAVALRDEALQQLMRDEGGELNKLIEAQMEEIDRLKQSEGRLVAQIVAATKQAAEAVNSTEPNVPEPHSETHGHAHPHPMGDEEGSGPTTAAGRPSTKEAESLEVPSGWRLETKEERDDRIHEPAMFMLSMRLQSCKHDPGLVLCAECKAKNRGMEEERARVEKARRNRQMMPDGRYIVRTDDNPSPEDSLTLQ